MGRVALIVGGSSGIGLATAVRLARQHDHLVLAARDAVALSRAQHQVESAGAEQVLTCPTDVRDPGDVGRLVERCLDRFGRIDAAVTTATTMAYGRIEDVPSEVFTAVVDTAVHGTANLARELVPVFRRQRQGTLVIVNSLLGGVTVPRMGAYATAKWGQRALARTLQQELRDEPRVHVCIVSPGSINTPIYYQAANYVGYAARPPIPVLQPDRVAEVIASVITRPRRHVSMAVGPGNAVITLGFRLMPAIYDAVVGPLFRLAALTRQPRPGGDGNVRTPSQARERVHGHWPDT